MDTPGLKKALSRRRTRPSTGKTPQKLRSRYQHKNKSQALTTLYKETFCWLCLQKPGKTKKDPHGKKRLFGVVEHLHRSLKADGSGPIRCHACRRCNSLEAVSLTRTLKHFNLSRKYFADSKNPLPRDFFKHQATLLQANLPDRSIKFLEEYLTGEFFKKMM